MKIYCLLIIVCLLAACKSKPSIVNTASAEIKQVKVLPASHKALSTVKATAQDSSETDDMADQYEDYYVVVADTGVNYYSLRDKMFELNQSFGIPIDTMDRHYNKAKDLIALPDNYDDDMYAGDYYPRREASDFLSLEYLNLYKEGSKAKTIALVRGIYEKKSSADSALKALQPISAFSIKSKIYIGCMH